MLVDAFRRTKNVAMGACSTRKVPGTYLFRFRRTRIRQTKIYLVCDLVKIDIAMPPKIIGDRMKDGAALSMIAVVSVLVVNLVLKNTSRWGLTNPPIVGHTENLFWSTTFATSLASVIACVATSYHGRQYTSGVHTETPALLLFVSLTCYIVFTMIQLTVSTFDLSDDNKDRAETLLPSERATFFVTNFVPLLLISVFSIWYSCSYLPNWYRRHGHQHR